MLLPQRSSVQRSTAGVLSCAASITSVLTIFRSAQSLLRGPSMIMIICATSSRGFAESAANAVAATSMERKSARICIEASTEADRSVDRHRIDAFQPDYDAAVSLIAHFDR